MASTWDELGERFDEHGRAFDTARRIGDHLETRHTIRVDTSDLEREISKMLGTLERAKGEGIKIKWDRQAAIDLPKSEYTIT